MDKPFMKTMQSLKIVLVVPALNEETGID